MVYSEKASVGVRQPLGSGLLYHRLGFVVAAEGLVSIGEVCIGEFVFRVEPHRFAGIGQGLFRLSR